MWYAIHWFAPMSKYCLFTGEKSGSDYRIEKIYNSELTAKISAGLHGYHFVKKGENK